VRTDEICGPLHMKHPQSVGQAADAELNHPDVLRRLLSEDRIDVVSYSMVMVEDWTIAFERVNR